MEEEIDSIPKRNYFNEEQMSDSAYKKLISYFDLTNYYLHKWWTESKEIAKLEKTAFSEVLHTADYYFGNGDDVPPDAALVPRKPKPGADPTAGSLPLPKSNQ